MSIESNKLMNLADGKVLYDDLRGRIPNVFYGTCNTAGGTATKEVTTSSNFDLTAGNILVVTFANQNTAYSTEIKLSVNSGTAKDVYFYGRKVQGFTKDGSIINGTVTFLYDGTQFQIVGAKPATILTYGESTWSEFLEAYYSNSIVYARGDNTKRLAFMCYIDGTVEVPTSVEFQYYRSVSSHSASQQGDQVCVYKLTSANGGTWSITTREASSKIVAGTNLTSSYSNGTLTLNNPAMTGAGASTAGAAGAVPAPAAGDNEKFLRGDGTWAISSSLPSVTSSDNGKVLQVVDGAWAAATIPAASGVSF